MNESGRRLEAPELRIVSCLLLVIPWMGCASIAGYSGIVISNFKSPITWEMHEKFPVNKPLDPEVHEALADRTRKLADGVEAGALEAALQCKGPSQEVGECLDPVHDPAEDLGHTTVLVAISGGGSRAAVFGAYALALLEADYNRVAARFAPDAPAMIDLIDGFSTVSGGSIYAFHVARRLAAPRKPFFRTRIFGKGGEEAGDEVGGTTSAQKHGPCVLPTEMQRWSEDRRQRYSKLCHTVEDRRPMRTLGTAAFQSVFGYFGLGIPVAIFTDRGYVDHLARGLEFYEPFSLWRVWAPLVNPFFIRADFLDFGDLPKRPRFFFNATALETGAPFVLTQNVMNLPAGKLPRRATRLDLPPLADQADDFRPLRHSLTLEEIGSSPRRFPIAYAAAASAAFPAGVEPLKLRRYDYREGLRRFAASEAQLSLADGGIFDNSGMMTAADFFEHLVRRTRVNRLILIAVNADASEYDLAFKERSFGPDESIGVRARAPLSFLSPTARSLDLIHYINKRRGEEIAWRQLERLQDRIQRREIEDDLIAALQIGGEAWRAYQDALGPLAQRVEKELRAQKSLSLPTYLEVQQALGPARNYVHYFPIGLTQLSRDDQDAIPDGDSLFQLVRQIGTSFWLSESEDLLLEKAASAIIRAEQQTGWSVGPNCPNSREAAAVTRLGEAVAFALLRADSESWDDQIEAEGGSAWCPH